MDNSYVSPSNGIVKLAEKEQDTVEYLFNEVLFADDGEQQNVAPHPQQTLKIFCPHKVSPGDILRKKK